MIKGLNEKSRVLKRKRKDSADGLRSNTLRFKNLCTCSAIPLKIHPQYEPESRSDENQYIAIAESNQSNIRNLLTEIFRIISELKGIENTIERLQNNFNSDQRYIRGNPEKKYDINKSDSKISDKEIDAEIENSKIELEGILKSSNDTLISIQSTKDERIKLQEEIKIEDMKIIMLTQRHDIKLAYYQQLIAQVDYFQTEINTKKSNICTLLSKCCNEEKAYLQDLENRKNLNERINILKSQKSSSRKR